MSLKPPTPRHPKHNAACPGCGEPMTVPFILGITAVEAKCSRCSTHFFVMGFRHSLTYHSMPDKKRMPAWVGDPLPGDPRYGVGP